MASKKYEELLNMAYRATSGAGAAFSAERKRDNVQPTVSPMPEEKHSAKYDELMQMAYRATNGAGGAFTQDEKGNIYVTPWQKKQTVPESEPDSADETAKNGPGTWNYIDPETRQQIAEARRLAAGETRKAETDTGTGGAGQTAADTASDTLRALAELAASGRDRAASWWQDALGKLPPTEAAAREVEEGKPVLGETRKAETDTGTGGGVAEMRKSVEADRLAAEREELERELAQIQSVEGYIYDPDEANRTAARKREITGRIKEIGEIEAQSAAEAREASANAALQSAPTAETVDPKASEALYGARHAVQDEAGSNAFQYWMRMLGIAANDAQQAMTGAWVSPEQQLAESEAAAEAGRQAAEAMDKYNAASEALDWPGRQELIDELRRLEKESAGEMNPAMAQRIEELREAIEQGDIAAGNGRQTYTARDYLGRVFESVAKGVGSAAANTLSNLAQTLGEGMVQQQLYSPEQFIMDTAAGQDWQEHVQQVEEALDSEETRADYAKIDAVADSLGAEAQEALQTAREGKGLIGRIGTDVLENVLEMGFDVGASVLSGNAMPVLGSMFMRVFGQSVGEARHEGAGLWQQTGYGLAKGAIEVATEKMFDVFGVLGGGSMDKKVRGLVRRLSDTPFGRGFLLVLAEAQGEGLEEIVSGILDPVAKLTLGQGWQGVDWEDAAYSYLIGSIIGLTGEATKITSGQVAYDVAQMETADSYQQQLTEAGAAEKVARAAADILASETYGEKLDEKEQAQLESVPEAEKLQTENRTAVFERVVRATAAARETDMDAGDARALAETLAEGYKADGTGARESARAAVEAYEMGREGAVAIEEARQESQHGTTISDEQFRAAYERGQRATDAAEGRIADTSTEEGRAALHADLAALGEYAQDAAAVYEDGQNLDRFVPAMLVAANFAADGADVDALAESARKDGKGVLGVLTGAQVEAAKQIGERLRADRAETVAAREAVFARLRETTGGKAFTPGTITLEEKSGRAGGLRYDAVGGSRLTRTQRAVVSIAAELSYATGLDIRVADFGKGVGGEYIPGSGGVVYLNIAAEWDGKNIAIASLSHELTHWLQEYAPEKYAELKRVLAAEMSRDPALFRAIFGERTRLQPNLKPEEITDEMVANACQVIFTDGEAVQRIVSEHRSFAEKLRDLIFRIIDDLKAAFAEFHAAESFPLMKEVKAAEGALDEMREMWLAAFDEASANLQAEKAAGKEKTAPDGGEAALVEDSEKQTRFQLFSDEEYTDVTGGLTETEVGELMQSKNADLREVRARIRERKAEETAWIDRVSSKDATMDEFTAWANESGLNALYEEEKQLDKETRMLAKRYDELSTARMEREEREAIEKSGLKEEDYFGKQAVKTFGYTPYYYDAGYIVPNGKMLNFSGEKGKHFGSRGDDHRAIGQIFANTKMSDAMFRFMGYGNIRIMAESPGLDISTAIEPTAEQYKTIRSFVRSVADEEYFAVDFTDKDGRTIGSMEYEGRISPAKVVADIQSFYETGKVPERSLSAFYQRWDDTTDDTAEEARGRAAAYARIQSENAILEETVEALRKLSTKQGKTIEALQKKLSITKIPETRTSDARNLARQLRKEHSSIADVERLTQEIKALGDYILQTEAAQLDENEIKSRARAIAREIVEESREISMEAIESYVPVRDALKGRKISIDETELGDVAEDFETLRKRLFGTVTLTRRAANTRESREGYLPVDVLYGNLQTDFGTALFPEITNEGEQLNAIVAALDAAKGLEVNPYEAYMGEATETLANQIAQDALSGVLRAEAPTTADRQRARVKQLQERIQALKKEGKLAEREAGTLYNTIYDLSMQLDRAESRYTTLEKGSARRIAELKAEGAARATAAKARERERGAKKIQALKDRYKELEKNAEQRRRNTASRQKIRRLMADLQRMLEHPTENKHVPPELTKATLDLLSMIDLNTGERGAEKAARHIADLRRLYERYRLEKGKDSPYSGVYDESISQMLDELAQNIGETTLQKMNEQQLDAVYRVLRAMTHMIETANRVRIGNQEREAYELSVSATKATRSIGKQQKGWIREHGIPSHLRPDVAFDRFGGFIKDSVWNQLARMLNDGQLKQTRLKMELSLPFAELFKNEKALRDYTAQKWNGKIDKSKLVDIGLKDENGNAVPVTRDFMVSLYLDLLNEDNRRHFVRGGKTVPDFEAFYSGRVKDSYGIGSTRVPGIAAQLAEARHAVEEAKNAGREENGGRYERKKFEGTEIGARVEEAEAALADLLDAGEQFAGEVQQNIEKQLTDYDRAWIKSIQQLMDEDSKRELNRTTMEVYGIEKATVPGYFPIFTDKAFVDKPMEVVMHDMSLENAGFMKERVQSGNPTYAVGSVWAVTQQIERVAQYCGLMPAIRNFNKVYNKTQSGYKDSMRKALDETFGTSGTGYVENLMADLQGGRHVEGDPLGIDKLFGALRGNLARTTLTLNARVALAQAASYPTAAAELGYKPLAKALAHGGKDGRVISRADQELIAKWSPLLWYRMQGYSMPETGDIQGSTKAADRLWRKLRYVTGWIQAVDGATVGRLWYAAEYWVQEHKPTLEKGTDAYYEAVAEKFNAVVEKTQPNYTTMQRAAILREPSTLVKSLTMFMTQRMQNFNILYDAWGRYDRAKHDLANKRNSVTEDDLREARTDFVRAASSQLAQAAVFVAFKLFADVLLRNLKKYRDKETGDITGEAVSVALLDAYCDALFGTMLLGSETYGIIKAVLTGSKWYGLSISGVDSFNDFVESVVNLANATVDLTNPKSVKAYEKKWLLLGTNLAQALGIPLNNALKIMDALKNYAIDGAQGQFLSYEAGFERTTAQNTEKLIRALESGDEAAIREATAAFASEKDALSKAKTRLKEDVQDGERTAADAEALLVTAGMDENDAFFAAQSMETGDDGRYTPVKRAAFAGDKSAFKEALQDMTSHGYKPKDVYGQVKSLVKSVYYGNALSETEADITGGKTLTDADARRMLHDYAGMSVDEANALVAAWKDERAFIARYGDTFTQYDLTVSQARYYYDTAKGSVTMQTYASQVERYGLDDVKAYYGSADKEGFRASGLSIEQAQSYREKRSKCSGDDKQAQIIALIDALPISREQKDWLFLRDYGKSSLSKTPWH